MSPVTINSQVGQANTTTQAAAISDLREQSLSIGISGSQLGFGGLIPRIL
jgi:hypothetical protein